MAEQIKKWKYRTYSLGSILKSPKDEELMKLLDDWARMAGNWFQSSVVRAPTA